MFSSCFPGARLDLSDEDNVVVLALTECSARPYAELIKSNIPGSSSLMSARSTASRPSPLSTLGVFFLWAYYCHSHQGRDFSSFGSDISEAPECEKEKSQLLCKGPAGSGQGSETGGVSSFSCPRAGAGVAALGRGSELGGVSSFSCPRALAGVVTPGQGSEIGGASPFSCPGAGAGVVTPGFDLAASL